MGTKSRGYVFEQRELNRKWSRVAVLEGHNDEISDIAWAPNMGRSFHLIATASKDEKVRIFKLVQKDFSWSVEIVATFDDHKKSVSRVEWNITGTILASSGEDGSVRLWKQSLANEWKNLCVIKGN